MRARMLALLDWFRPRLGAQGVSAARIRRRPARLISALESLERREVLSTAPTFLPFAALPGQVTTAGTTAEVTVHFSAGQVTSSNASSVLVGFYVVPNAGSTSTPTISEVDGPAGVLTQVSLPKRDHSTPSKSLFITSVSTSTTTAQDITIKVVEPSKQVGGFTLEAFLPGDVNNDGTVDLTDQALVQSAYGTGLGQANNNPAADFNADGHVGCIDLRLTQMNQGAHVTYGTPAVVATVVPAVTPVAVSVATVPTTVPVTSAVPVTGLVPVVSYVPQSSVAIPVSATNQVQATTLATTPTYYYGQPTVQAPGYTTAAPTTTGYYYGQAAAQVPTAPTGYYYGQPTVQASTTTPAYYYGQAAVPVTSAATTYSYGQAAVPVTSATNGYSYGQAAIPVATSGSGYYYGQPTVQASSPTVSSATIPVTYLK